MSERHPDDASLAEYAQGDLAPAEVADIERHLEGCPDCRGLLAQLLKVLDGGAMSGPRRGLVVGRYVVLDPVGAGALGEVYSAHDSSLERLVALKWLFPSIDEADRRALRQRLLAEARALAQVQHPNVVAVHDVLEHDGADVIVMELVHRAKTLRETSKGAAWHDTVRSFAGAARGLAAAHRAGVLHRDFKPDNVLLDGLGRVVVVDFGLARQFETEPSAPASAPRSTLSGTPAYLAPERWQGQPSTAASDQFSFCVALHECLSGALPFSAPTAEGRLDEVRRGPLALPRAVSGAVAAAVRRGLSFDPAARWPSMDELARALDDALEAPRRRRSFVTAGVVLGAAVLLLGVSARLRQTRCADADAPVRATWTAARREAVVTAFLATKHPAAEALSQQLSLALDAAFAAVGAKRRRACEATAFEGDSELALDARQACLGRRLSDLDALVHGLEAADGKAVERSMIALESLPSPEGCFDPTFSSEPLPSGAARAQVEAVVARVATVRATRLLGRVKDSVALAEPVAAEARAAGFRPVTSDALLEWANGLERLSKFEPARALALEALELAVAARDHRQAFDATVGLAYLDGVDLKRRDVGATWARLAHAFVAPEHQRSLSERLRLGNVEAVLLMLDDKAALAVPVLTTLEHELAATGQLETVNGARLYSNLSGALRESGRAAEGIEAARRSLALMQQVVSPNHPDVAAAANNLGSALADVGRLEDAEVALRQSVALRERLFGQDAPQLATPHYNLGELALRRGNGAAALEGYGRSRAILEKTVGPDSDDVWDAKMGEALAVGLVGRHADAVAQLEVVLPELERRKLPAWNLAQAKLGLAESLQALGREPARVAALLDWVTALEGPRHQAQREKAKALRAR